MTYRYLAAPRTLQAFGLREICLLFIVYCLLFPNRVTAFHSKLLIWPVVCVSLNDYSDDSSIPGQFHSDLVMMGMLKDLSVSKITMYLGRRPQVPDVAYFH